MRWRHSAAATTPPRAADLRVACQVPPQAHFLFIDAYLAAYPYLPPSPLRPP